ncbi:hypothetical protein BJX99DRAFT_266546 [Aspergillus californicus]
MQRSQRRSTKVCTRCRQRKSKCDFKFPQCTACASANATCLGFDPATKNAVPRSLVKSLEARVALLEAQLLAVQSTSQSLPYSMASRIAKATVSLGVPKPGPYLQSKVSAAWFLRPSCPPLAISPTAEERRSESDHENTRSRQPSIFRSNLIDMRSVPHSALERMIRNYTEIHLPQYPIISDSMLDEIVQCFRGSNQGDPDSPGLGHFELFVLFIVLAISASTLTWRAEMQAREASEAFYSSAMNHLQLLEDYGELKELQISLLLAHYAHMCPERIDNWTCISNAVRIVLSLGIYRECPAGLDRKDAQLRARLFWVTYGMERSLCTNLRLPLSFPEDVITTQKKSSANHIYRYRILETEVHRVLYLGEEMHKSTFTSIDEWILDVTSRLDAWYTEAQTYTPYNMLEFKHLQFHHLKARIYRPTPRLRTKSAQDLGIVLESSRKLIDDYLGQERRQRLFYPWHGVHILFETASIALDASWSARDYNPLVAEAVDMVQIWIPQCLSLLSAIGKRWNEATACVSKLSPLVQRVSSAFVSPDHDASVAEDINALLFSDRPPGWNPGVSGDDFCFDDLPVDDLEFLQWGADWDIMPSDMLLETGI